MLPEAVSMLPPVTTITLPLRSGMSPAGSKVFIPVFRPDKSVAIPEEAAFEQLFHTYLKGPITT